MVDLRQVCDSKTRHVMGEQTSTAIYGTDDKNKEFQEDDVEAPEIAADNDELAGGDDFSSISEFHETSPKSASDVTKNKQRVLIKSIQFVDQSIAARNVFWFPAKTSSMASVSGHLRCFLCERLTQLLLAVLGQLTGRENNLWLENWPWVLMEKRFFIEAFSLWRSLIRNCRWCDSMLLQIESVFNAIVWLRVLFLLISLARGARWKAGFDWSWA